MWFSIQEKVSVLIIYRGLLLTNLIDTIRIWSFGDSPLDDDYRKCHPHHAPTYLASYLQQVRSLQIFPSMTRYSRKLYTENQCFHDLVGGHFSHVRPCSSIDVYSTPKSKRFSRSNMAGRMTSERPSGRLYPKSLGSESYVMIQPTKPTMTTSLSLNFWRAARMMKVFIFGLEGNNGNIYQKSIIR